MRYIHSDHRANGPRGLSWKGDDVLGVEDDKTANDLLKLRGFREVSASDFFSEVEKPKRGRKSVVETTEGEAPEAGEPEE